ncbi:hypothetical protein C9374_010416 [Naegleria lovaniensis]|uniref:PhnB-like domain-containing protein n=1 Tax=Naegleria lovaniensis TaxID=51637 RepID=A0AA88GBM7_NAELO|nr:uncharacterized protein C9374_010416 [Naegleria lovaniensis]KAG2374672.1 hypothetical protein C9374_010416 [Naegleria lovaniensis]
MKVSPYLFFDGKCEQVLKFYQSVLGGELHMQRYSDVPQCENSTTLPQQDWNDKILHGSLCSSNSSKEMIMMACDAKEMGKLHGGYSLSVDVDDPEQGLKIFQALSEGGKVLMNYGKTFWARGYGMLEDQFGVVWHVNCH